MVYKTITHDLIKKVHNNCKHHYDIDDIMVYGSPLYDCSLEIYYNITDDIIESEHEAFGDYGKHYGEQIENKDYLLITTIYGCNIYDEIYKICKTENFVNNGEPQDGDDFWFWENTHYCECLENECKNGAELLIKLYNLVDKYNEIQNR